MSSLNWSSRLRERPCLSHPHDCSTSSCVAYKTSCTRFLLMQLSTISVLYLLISTLYLRPCF